MAIRLKTPQDARRCLARVVNELYSGKLDPKTANSMTLALNGVLASLRLDEQQRELELLAERLDELEGQA